MVLISASDHEEEISFFFLFIVQCKSIEIIFKVPY